MGHLTLKMIGILISSLLIFGLAHAENRAEKAEEKEQEVTSSSAEDRSKEERDKKAKAEKAAERFRAQQSIQRALRDQGQSHGPIPPAKH